MLGGLADLDNEESLLQAHSFLKHAPSARVRVQWVFKVKVTDVVFLVPGTKVKVGKLWVLVKEALALLVVRPRHGRSVLIVFIQLEEL